MKTGLLLLSAVSALCAPCAATAQDRARVEIAMITFGSRLVTFSVSVGLGADVQGSRSVTITSVGTGATGQRQVPDASAATSGGPSASRGAGQHATDTALPVAREALDSCVLIDAAACGN